MVPPFDPAMLVRFAFPELPTEEELDALTAPMLDAAHDTLDTLNPETPDP